MGQYKGMRWFKCDFQVQTPEFSSDWQDADLKLTDPRRPIVEGIADEADLQQKARSFLRRCHALELEVVGITDHNFSAKKDTRDWFLTHLVEQNKSVAAELGRPPLWIFPGFEVDIGFHVLCLFEPSSKSSRLADVSEVLTTLGLGVDTRFKAGRPVPLRYDNKYVALSTLLQVVQNEKGGIVIAAHAFSKDGICNDSMHIDDYRNEDLLCVEVPDSQLSGKAKDILGGNNRDWSRKWRQPAAVMSSDAKSLRVEDDGRPGPNCLGFRYTWVKMSTPSIEALRQAFLDPASRVSLPSLADRESPESRLGYPRFNSISVSKLAFLEDQDVRLSPNLNCVIGGRGTGKSTLLECIRFALDRPSSNSDVIRKGARIRRTFSNETEIKVAWQASPGLEDEIVFTPGVTADEWRWDGKTEEQTRAFLRQIPVQIFSQGELTEIASDEGAQGNRLLPLVDAMHSAELGELISSEAMLRADVMKLYAATDQKAQIASDLARVELELQELNRQWSARKEVQLEAESHRLAQAAEQYMRELTESIDEDVEALRVALDDGIGAGNLPIPEVLANSSSAGWYDGLRQMVLNWKLELRAKRDALAIDAKASANAITIENASWKTAELTLRRDQDHFFEVCRERGLHPDDVSRLQELDRQRQSKARDIEERKRRLASIVAEMKELEKRPEELSANWLKQFLLRSASIAALNGLTAPNVIASVRFMGDEVTFTGLWIQLMPDGRTKLGRIWQELGQSVFVSHLARQDQAAIWDWLRDWALKGKESPGMEKYEDVRQDLVEYLTGSARSKWREVRNTRVDDFVDLTLFRSGGQRIGSISGGELSEGQRNTAVLTMLLAQGSGPMVIDQPEDEVDSNFLYEHLVPLLRTAKTQRQLIFVTHNANIPVNADSELIYALESVSGRGRVRVEGGLDMKPVTAAVLDIMEGTDEAFRRRSEKYHF